MPTAQQLDSLSALLGDPMAANAADLKKKGLNRNPANAAALEAFLGIKPSPYGFSSEADLQSAADAKRAGDISEKVAPIQATGANELAVEGAKTAGAQALEGQKAQAASALSAQEAAQGRQSLADIQGTSTAGQPMAARGTATGEGFDVKPSINTKGQVAVGLSPSKPAQQIEAQMHAAAAGASQIPITREMINQLESQGMLGPVVGRIESGSAATGLDPLAEMLHLQPKGGSRAFNAFKTQLSLTKSNLAYAHGAARGGSSPAMQQRFDELFNPNQTPDALRGALDTAERWLQMYSSAKSPEEAKAIAGQIDSELGVQ